jgi:hypothetical protein
MSAKHAADRFNLFNHNALASFHLINNGVAEFPVNRSFDYSMGISQRATGKKGPTRGVPSR